MWDYNKIKALGENTSLSRSLYLIILALWTHFFSCVADIVSDIYDAVIARTITSGDQKISGLLQTAKA